MKSSILSSTLLGGLPLSQHKLSSLALFVRTDATDSLILVSQSKRNQTNNLYRWNNRFAKTHYKIWQPASEMLIHKLYRASQNESCVRLSSRWSDGDLVWRRHCIRAGVKLSEIPDRYTKKYRHENSWQVKEIMEFLVALIFENLPTSVDKHPWNSFQSNLVRVEEGNFLAVLQFHENESHADWIKDSWKYFQGYPCRWLH